MPERAKAQRILDGEAEAERNRLFSRISGLPAVFGAVAAVLHPRGGMSTLGIIRSGSSGFTLP